MSNSVEAAPGHLTRRIAATFAVLLGAYLVVRAGVELVTVDYGNPASYRADWGGPSLAGVLAVHAGPGLAVLAYAGYRMRRIVRLVRVARANGAVATNRTDRAR